MFTSRDVHRGTQWANPAHRHCERSHIMGGKLEEEEKPRFLLCSVFLHDGMSNDKKLLLFGDEWGELQSNPGMWPPC